MRIALQRARLPRGPGRRASLVCCGVMLKGTGTLAKLG